MSKAYLSIGRGCNYHALRSAGLCLTWFGMVWLGLGVSGCKPRQGEPETAQVEADPQFWIRVLLLRNTSNCTVQLPPGFSIRTDPGAEDLQQPELEGTRRETISIPIEAQGGQLRISDQVYDTRELDIWPGRDRIFSLDQKQYRGRIRIVLRDNGSRFDLINLVPLEAYLAGVVGAEMPAFWHAEALKVQAVVARTYCLHTKRRFGRGRSWDLNKTQAHQVYQGVKAEHERVWDAVNQTRGQCLTGQGADDHYVVFPTYYSAICGGHTENSKHVFGDSFVPLSGVACAYCKDVAKLGQYLWPMARYDKKAASDKILRRYAKLRALRRIVALTPAHQSEYGDYARITSFKLTGVNGKTDYLRAEDLRLTLDPSGRTIKSAVCGLADWGDQWAFISGRGWGHGVGLCQCGAQGLAKTGSAYQDILQYYYPGSRVINIYESGG